MDELELKIEGIKARVNDMKEKCRVQYKQHFEIRRIDANHMKCFTCNMIWNNQEFEDEYGDMNDRN